MFFFKFLLTLSWWRPLPYRNQSTDLLRKSMDWLLYDNGVRHERVKMGKKWRKMLSPTYSLKFKNIILFLNRGLYFFSNAHIRNVVSTLPDLENDNVVSMFSNVVQFNIEKHNIVLRSKFQRWHTQSCFNVDVTLCDVATSYQPENNVEPTFKCLLGACRSLIFIKVQELQIVLTAT